MKTLYIRDEITNDLCLSSNSYLTYLGILMMKRKNENEYLVKSDCLAYLLTRQYPVIKAIDKFISDGMELLLDRQVVTAKQVGKSNEWIIDTSDMDLCEVATDDNKPKQTKFYTIVDELDIKKILLSNEKYYTRSISLVRFYIYILSTMFKKKNEYRGIGFTSVTDMSTTYNLNMKTVLSYLKQLEELKLIYIYHAKDSIKFDTGEIREITHTYGRYEDKERVMQLGKKHEQEYGMKVKASHKKIQNDKKNATRSITQKYRHLCKCIEQEKEITYTYDECKVLYFEVVEFNDKYSYRPDRVKDLGVFSGFDFYNTE